MTSSSELAAQALERIADIVRERGAEHGDCIEGLGMTAQYWSLYLSHRPAQAITARDVAVMMALLKVSRMCHGDSGNLDHYDDMTGYAAIARVCANTAGLGDYVERDQRGQDADPHADAEEIDDNEAAINDLCHQLKDVQ